MDEKVPISNKRKDLMDSPRVLVLNQSFEPIQILSARRAVVLIITGKAERLEESDRVICSPSMRIVVPSVIRLYRYIPKPVVYTVAFTKKNILKRDGFICQYCGRDGGERMTIDHVIPKSMGGRTIWENVVSACLTCNLRKGNKTLTEAGMRLLRKPVRPLSIFYLNIMAQPSYVSPKWVKYLAGARDFLSEHTSIPGDGRRGVTCD